MVLKKGGYYMLVSPPGHFHLYGVSDVENWPVCVPLANDEVVVCASFVHRSGGQGDGKYAKLLHQRSDKCVVLYQRVSRTNSASGTWRELEPLEVLAMASAFPTV